MMGHDLLFVIIGPNLYNGDRSVMGRVSEMITRGIVRTVAACILPAAIFLWGCGTVPGERGHGDDGFSAISVESFQEAESEDTEGGDEVSTAPPGEEDFIGPPATRLYTVSVERLEKGVEIHIRADGPIRDYVTFLLDNPDRTVYDLYGLSSPHSDEQVLAVDASPWLDGVRHYGHSRKVRVVLDGGAAFAKETKALTIQDGLLIRIGSPARDVPPPERARPEAVAIAHDYPFIAYEDGTVLDTRTNLMWAAGDNGSDIHWEDARLYCETYRGGQYDDWRMPLQHELAELYDRSRHYKPTQRSYDVHLTALIKLSTSWVWASERRDYDAAAFSFYNGSHHWFANSYGSSLRALPVRSAQ